MSRLTEVTNLTPICRRAHSHRTAGIVTGISNMWCKKLEIKVDKNNLLNICTYTRDLPGKCLGDFFWYAGFSANWQQVNIFKIKYLLKKLQTLYTP